MAMGSIFSAKRNVVRRARTIFSIFLQERAFFTFFSHEEYLGTSSLFTTFGRGRKGIFTFSSMVCGQKKKVWGKSFHTSSFLCLFPKEIPPKYDLSSFGISKRVEVDP